MSEIKYDYLDDSHITLLWFVNLLLKMILMIMVSGQVFCGSINPFALTNCDYDLIVLLTAWEFFLCLLFGAYIYYVKNSKKYIPKIMKMDFMFSTMIFTIMYISPELLADKALLWLSLPWLIAILLAQVIPSNSIYGKIGQFGSVIGVIAIIFIHFSIDYSIILDSSSLIIILIMMLGIISTNNLINN